MNQWTLLDGGWAIPNTWIVFEAIHSLDQSSHKFGKKYQMKYHPTAVVAPSYKIIWVGS